MLRSLSLVAVLALFPLLNASAGEIEVPTACDLLAAHPSDPDRIVAGVSASVVREDLDTAIEACRRAVADDPEASRLVYYLGRVLFYSGNFLEGMEYVDQAAAMGHRQSQFVSALIHFDGVPDALPADACRAMGLWADAAGRGHYAASLAVARHSLAGAFGDCEGAPSAAQMHGWIEQQRGRDEAQDYYHGLVIGLLLDLLARESA
ncbi:MAG: sel1 repeat family protein [Gammaproteobacteria bacterium]|nr:sel1 repeat family protein [Gammaproteobacteria bacterium]TVQ48268.1 MAG: sel1 repeat family protein [Gammaproteobacteria bacterium]